MQILQKSESVKNTDIETDNIITKLHFEGILKVYISKEFGSNTNIYFFFLLSEEKDLR